MEVDHSECCVRINSLEARARGAEVLSRHLEETQQENALLRHHIAMYDDVMARLQNRLETFASMSSESVPAASRTMVDSLLERNQQLNLEIRILRQQLELQGGGENVNSEREDELLAENESLRTEVQELKVLLDDLRTDGHSGRNVLLARVEKAERLARTKTTLCEFLASQLEQKDSCDQSLVLEANGSEQCQRCPALESKVTEYKTAIDQQRVVIDSMREQQNELTVHCEELEKSLRESQAGYNQAKVQLNEVTANSDEHLRQLYDLQREHTELQTRLNTFNDLQREHTELQTRLVTIKQQNQSQTRQIADLRIDHVREIQRLEEESSSSVMAHQLEAEEYRGLWREEREKSTRLENEMNRLYSRYPAETDRQTVSRSPFTPLAPPGHQELVGRGVKSRHTADRFLGLQAVADSPSQHAQELKVCSLCCQSVPADMYDTHVRNKCK